MRRQKSWDWVDWALGWGNADIVYYVQINKEISLVDFGGSYLYRREDFRPLIQMEKLWWTFSTHYQYPLVDPRKALPFL